jgi:hypothetical protein
MAFNNQEAVTQLAQALGLEGFKLDAGECELILDEDMSVMLVGDADKSTLRLAGIVGDLLDRDDVEALRLLLEANYGGQATGGAALALDPITSEVVLGQLVDVSTLGPKGLEPVVTEFANYLEFWQSNLAGLADEAGETQADDTAATDPFMRV